VVVFRAVVYLPAVIPVVAAGGIWLLFLNAQIGWLDHWLAAAGLPARQWLGDEFWAKPALVLISLWQIGSYVVIFLQGLQSIPAQLYEGAEIDGAGALTKLVSVTVPMTTPTILYVTVIDLIASFQVFSLAFVITQGGPADQTLFYVLYLYREAFSFLKMGYASAMAAVLFVVTMALTLIVIRSSRGCVQYERV